MRFKTWLELNITDKDDLFGGPGPSQPDYYDPDKDDLFSSKPTRPTRRDPVEEFLTRYAKIGPEEMLELFSTNRAFIYSVSTDKVYISTSTHHEDLLDAMKTHDPQGYVAARAVYNAGRGVVGRVAYNRKGTTQEKVRPIPHGELLVAMYDDLSGYTEAAARRAVQLLLGKDLLGAKKVEPTSYVAHKGKITTIAEFLGMGGSGGSSPSPSPQPEVPSMKTRITDPRELEVMSAALKAGRWQDGRDLAPLERDYIQQQVALSGVGKGGSRDDRWQAALVKNKLISPAVNFRRPYADATIHEGVVELDAGSFPEFLHSAPVVVVMYGTESCRLCQMSQPWVEELSSQGHAIAKVDIGRQPELGEEAALGMLPTFDVYRGGVRAERITGAKKFSVQRAFGLIHF